ncbi:MAG: HEAT repeat domain-containing protein [Acidobacteriota bacterium]
MNTPSRTHRRVNLATLLTGIVLCAPLFTEVHCEASQRQQVQTLDEVINDITRGQVSPVILRQVVEARALQAVPALKQQFAVNAGSRTKQIIASALVRLGDADPTYWDFLADLARVAVENNAPFPIPFDMQRQMVRRQLTSAFNAWAYSRNTSPESAAETQIYGFPADLAFMAETGDVRGLPLLRAGLSSPNYFIQAMAARGLALLQDTTSISAIIDACRTAPPEFAALIAQWLVFFNDTRAQNAAVLYVPDQVLLDEWRRLYRDKGPAGVFSE